MNSKAVGELSEAIVMARFIKKGWVVLKPWGDNQRYDFVIDRGLGFERVQVKTGRLRKGAVVFNAYSSDAHRGGGKRTYDGQADWFAVYCQATDQVYLLPVGAAAHQCYLRVEPSKNNQDKNIRWAREYEI